MKSARFSVDLDAELVQCLPELSTDAARLAVLRALAIVDTPPEAVFDAITRLATSLTGRPISLIGLVDADRTWFKSVAGVSHSETDNNISFCARAIASDDVFEVPDANRDMAFAANPLVQGPPYVRFYAGVPLRVDGHAVGTLCVVDHEPYRLNPEQRAGLKDLALLAMHVLQGRLKAEGGA
jgi:GAF domain-containing protein